MRLVLCLILSAAAGWLGYSSAFAEKRREARLNDMIAGLEMLKAEICTRLAPLPDCIEYLASAGPELAREFYKSLGLMLPLIGETQFSRLWEAALAPLELPPGARECLAGLGPSLGRFDASARAAAIERALTALGPLSREAHERTRTALRLRAGLGLAAGAMLAVMLY